MAKRISGSNSMAQILAMILSQRRESAKDRRQMAMQMAMLKEKGRTEMRNALYKSWLDAEDETKRHEIARQLNSQFGFNLPTGKGKVDEDGDSKIKEAYDEGGLLEVTPALAESAGRKGWEIIGGPHMVDKLGKGAYNLGRLIRENAPKPYMPGQPPATEEETPHPKWDPWVEPKEEKTKSEPLELYNKIKNLPKEEQIRILQREMGPMGRTD